VDARREGRRVAGRGGRVALAARRRHGRPRPDPAHAAFVPAVARLGHRPALGARARRSAVDGARVVAAGVVVSVAGDVDVDCQPVEVVDVVLVTGTTV